MRCRRNEESKLKLERFYIVSRDFVDSINGRIFLTIAMYAVFIYLLNSSGPDQAFSLVLPISTGVTVFLLLRDSNLRRAISRGYFSVLSIVLATIILLVFHPPKLAEWYTIFLLQGFREEVFFRFFMMGLLGKWLFSEGGVELSLRSILLLISNTVFFAMGHAQYGTDLASLMIVFILGILFGYFFINMGLITSIILHAMWNIYLPLRWPATILFLGLFTIDLLHKNIPKRQRAAVFV